MSRPLATEATSTHPLIMSAQNNLTSLPSSRKEPQARRGSRNASGKGANRNSDNGLSVQDLTPEDFIVVIMGPIGTGKSTFIQEVTGRNWDVGHTLASGTSECKAVRMQPTDGVNVVLVDTPGFQDNQQLNAEVLLKISKWFTGIHNRSLEVSGIIYLHRIIDPRISGKLQENLKMFQSLCRDDFYKRVFLTTTMWPVIIDNDKPHFHNRQVELETAFWADMIAKGARSRKFRGTRKSAQDILNEILIDATNRRKQPICKSRTIPTEPLSAIPPVPASQREPVEEIEMDVLRQHPESAQSNRRLGARQEEDIKHGTEGYAEAVEYEK
ncbi:hypothetical protein AN958_02174 [Leucoagaricus sp. SymC.cos]|nr:hypothetical protein AN958_02174 [Leucoagaricus sp. SymC.cos]